MRPKPSEWITRERAVGMKFGMLTVVEVLAPDDEKTRRHPNARCECECGNSCVKRLNNVIQGMTKSCGCIACIRNPRPRRNSQLPVSLSHVNAALKARIE